MNDDVALAEVDAQSGLAREVREFVTTHPELGHEETRTSSYLAGVLRDGGLSVEHGIADMETAFRATLTGSHDGRTVGLVMLYDAVPSILPDGSMKPVHSCGHGSIAAGVAAAALALTHLRPRLAGRIVVVGCPADEIHAPGTVARGGGKALSADRGVWDDIDAALYVHPEFIDTVSRRSQWMRRQRLRVSGRRSLRAGAEQPPLDALRALTEVVSESDPSRVMLESVRLDGDVEEDTGLVLDASVLVFGEDEAEVAATELRLRDRVRGEWSEGGLVAGVRPNAAVTAAVAEAFAASGGAFVADPPPLPFATDFGNISRRVPAALIGVGRPGGWSFHTDEGAEQFASDDGHDAAMRIARVLTLTALRLCEPE